MNTMNKNDQGYALLGALVLLTIGLAVSATMMNTTSTGMKTRALVKTHADYNYECEETLNKTAAWLQANSQNMVAAFKSANFSTNFEFGTPVAGDNEGQYFEVPTVVKRAGTNDSAILSNNSFLGVASFPTSVNPVTSATFDPVAAFQSADLGKANARAMVVWARESDGDYAPIFRIDAVTGNNPDRGAHMYTYVYSQLVTGALTPVNPGDGIGFFSNAANLTTKTGNNQCYSYEWTFNGTAWSKGAAKSNCVVASNQSVILESRINGNALSNVDNGVSINKPNGEVSGTVCEHAACHSYSMTAFPTWADTCTGHSQGNLVISSDTSLASGATLDQQCWDTITINSNRTLTLTDKVNPYRIKSLAFQNNSNSKLKFPLLNATEKIKIYLDSFAGGQINGNQFVNTNNAPRNLEVYITSTTDFKLNGTADVYARFIAPVSAVELLGTFNFHGAIHAKKFDVTGNGTFNYDEGIADIVVPEVVDMTLTLKKASQRYR